MSFKIIGGYKFDKRIFRLSLLLMVLVFIFGWGLTGFANPMKPAIYVHCPQDSVSWCENPFFTGAIGQVWDTTNFVVKNNLEDMSHIPPGYTYGEKPPFFIVNMGYIFLLIGVFAFAFNHWKHNKELIT